MNLNFPSLSVIGESAYQTFQRFPLVIVSSLIGTASVVWLINQNGATEILEAKVFALSFVGFLGISWLFAFTILLEQFKIKIPLKWGSIVIAALILVGYYFYIDSILIDARYEVWYQLALFFLATHLFAAFAPFVNSINRDQFWEYNKNLFLRILISVLYSAALFVGLSIAMYALDVLLEINIEEEFYPSLFIIIGGVFNTWFFLWGVPSKEKILKNEINYPTGLKVFVQYVLIPLVTAYIIILYAYLSKIILQWELPNGWVANLVLTFSIAGILSLLLLYPIQENEDKKWIQLFSKWYYRALIPLIGLLLFSIWVRISEYGVTINRFFVATLGVWLTCIVIYFIVSKVKSIKVIPMSLAAFVVFSAIGPLSAFNVSERSQLGRLMEIIESNNIELPASESPNQATIPESEIIEIQSIVHYLVDNHGVESFSSLLGEEKFAAINDASNSKKIILEDFLGVPHGTGLFIDGMLTGQNYAYKFYENPTLNISGYKYFLGTFGFNSSELKHSFTIEESEFSLTFNDEKLIFVLKGADSETDISILKTLRSLHATNDGDWYSSSWDSSQIIIKKDTAELGLLLLITSVSGQTGPIETVSNINIQVFVK